MPLPTRTSAGAAGLSAALLLLAACADSTAPTESAIPISVRGNNTGIGYVDVCKRSGPANIPFTFEVSVVGGSGYTLRNGSTFQLLVGQCKSAVVAADPLGTPAEVTVSEVNLPNGIQLDRIEILGSSTPILGTNSATVTGQYGVYQMIKFYNSGEFTPPPPPPPAEYGCTPGYWKQDHHFGNWTGYTPDQSYNSVFGVSLFGAGTTLLDALSTGGGKEFRFGRHSTAALLNSSRLGLNLYGMTTAQVISAVQTAVAQGPEAMDALASRFAGMNERGCPLGRAE